MALREIRKFKDPILRKKARPVVKIDKRLLTLLDDMVETMKKAEGVGLAAPQVGILKRVVVIADMDEDKIIELINPEIIAQSGEQVGPEGCLSFPGMSGTVKRPEQVTVRAMDRKGEIREVTGTGIIARAFCHEIDHLDGIVFLDKVIPEPESDQESDEQQEETAL
ncbi:peptide deformylase [Mahella australiensis]|uniref:Peptide deformylase n=1 Tax=Mahella australiensis (strain DSM 15567 / CIP 107919 / 50-1 BON) TaxID=697281 RepID=F4A2D4_MAHA5|nr:peptide deformylase [Mahella australiensis]AEE96181.1 peptide deformylase [Mahella australiensis 50-1 BON]